MINLKKPWLMIAILAFSYQISFGSARTTSRALEALKALKLPKAASTAQPYYGQPIYQPKTYGQPTYQPTTWTDWYKQWSRPEVERPEYVNTGYKKKAAALGTGVGLLGLLKGKKSEEEEKEEKYSEFFNDLFEQSYADINRFIVFNPSFLKERSTEFFESMIANKPTELKYLIDENPFVKSYFVTFLSKPEHMDHLIANSEIDYEAKNTLYDVISKANETEKELLAKSLASGVSFKDIIQHKAYLPVFDKFLESRNQNVANEFALAIATNSEGYQNAIKEYAGTGSSPVILLEINKLIAAAPDASKYLSSFIGKNLEYLAQDPYGREIIERLEEERLAREAGWTGKIWKRFGY